MNNFFLQILKKINKLDDYTTQYLKASNNIEIPALAYTNWGMHLAQTKDFKSAIDKLETASKNLTKWSKEAEKGKSKKYNPETTIDKGYVGHKASKMMKSSKVMEQKIQKEIDEKANLLKNIDINEDLKIIPLKNNKNPLVLADKLQIKYNEQAIFKPISFEVDDGDRIAIIGKNGIGKSSILKLIIGKEIQYTGELKKISNLKISYVSQDTEYLNGNLKSFAQENKIDESIFKAMLVKMGLTKYDFDTNIQDMSEGQKKKVLIAKSISEQANIYIWDEPLNYIDILTREQIEDAILNYNITIIFVEHDETFIEKVATKIINLER